MMNRLTNAQVVNKSLLASDPYALKEMNVVDLNMYVFICNCLM